MAEDEEMLEEEMYQMFVESERSTVISASAFEKEVITLKRINPISVEEGITAQDAMDSMLKHKIGCMLVVKKGKLTGIITEGDIARRIVGAKKDALKVNVENIMTQNPECQEPDASIAFVLNAMVVGGYRHIPIVDKKLSPVAVISVNDIMRYLVSFFSEEILNLPPKPILRTKDREGA